MTAEALPTTELGPGPEEAPATAKPMTAKPEASEVPTATDSKHTTSNGGGSPELHVGEEGNANNMPDLADWSSSLKPTGLNSSFSFANGLMASGLTGSASNNQPGSMPHGSTGFQVKKIGEPRPIQRCEEIQHIHEDHETRTVEQLPDRVVEVPIERIVEHIVEVPEIQTVERVVEDIIEIKKIRIEEEIIEREVEQIVEVERVIEVPQIHKKIRQVPVEVVQEQVIEVPRVELRRRGMGQI